MVKRILFIYLPVFPWPKYFGFVSGGERHFIELAKRLSKENFELFIITTEKGLHILENENINFMECFLIKHSKITEMLQQTNIRIVLTHILRIIKALSISSKLNRKINILCAPSHFIYEVLPIVYFKKYVFPKAKVITYIHHIEPPPIERLKYSNLIPSFLIWISQCISIYMIKKFSDIVFTNFSEISKALSLGVPYHKLRIIYNGINLEEIKNIHTVKKRYDACFLARLTPTKGIYDLVKAWKIVCDKIHNAKLGIAGAGEEPYISNLKELVKKLNLEENIEILGPLSKSRKYLFLKSGKVFLYPSYLEGWGIVVYEAMACGLPVIAYNLPAYKLIKSKAFIRVPVGDFRLLAKYTIKLLSDLDTLQSLSKVAYRYAINFTWDKVLKDEIKVYHEI